jgi:hypothetical protein
MATHTLVYFSGGSSLLVRESLKEVTSQFTEGTTAAMLTYMGGGKATSRSLSSATTSRTCFRPTQPDS